MKHEIFGFQQLTDLYISRRKFFIKVKRSNSRRFWINIIESQEWSKTCPFKNELTQFSRMFWMVTNFALEGYRIQWQFFHHFNVRLETCNFFLSHMRTLFIGKWVYRKIEFDIPFPCSLTRSIQVPKYFGVSKIRKVHMRTIDPLLKKMALIGVLKCIPEWIYFVLTKGLIDDHW